MGDNIFILIFYSVIAIFIMVTFFLVLYIRNQNMLWQQRRLFQETEILQQKQLLNAVIESQEIERKRIGEDLHDEIGGTLSAIKLMLGALKQQDATNQDVVLPAKQLIDKMIVDVRNIAHDLSPPGLAMFGLYTTIEGFVSLINNTGEIEVVVTHDPHTEERVLSDKAELALFRIITQLIANTLKHAEAKRIELCFKPDDQNIKIIYNDNGKGFDPTILNAKQGIGMQNIKSRLQMIDANYTIETSLNNGFKMTIVCPVDRVN
ncbi:sensor histidine kinase [Pedobacter sp. UC225_65]|uniref:sensor histidine kinase n=1 Tax=Pedobacter sp. UC225_65 TaxID=3350173 RepID=UPI0036707DDB